MNLNEKFQAARAVTKQSFSPAEWKELPNWKKTVVAVNNKPYDPKADNRAFWYGQAPKTKMTSEQKRTLATLTGKEKGVYRRAIRFANAHALGWFKPKKATKPAAV